MNAKTLAEKLEQYAVLHRELRPILEYLELRGMLTCMIRVEQVEWIGLEHYMQAPEDCDPGEEPKIDELELYFRVYGERAAGTEGTRSIKQMIEWAEARPDLLERL